VRWLDSFPDSRISSSFGPKARPSHKHTKQNAPVIVRVIYSLKPRFTQSSTDISSTEEQVRHTAEGSRTRDLHAPRPLWKPSISGPNGMALEGVPRKKRRSAIRPLKWRRLNLFKRAFTSNLISQLFNELVISGGVPHTQDAFVGLNVCSSPADWGRLWLNPTWRKWLTEIRLRLLYAFIKRQILCPRGVQIKFYIVIARLLISTNSRPHVKIPTLPRQTYLMRITRSGMVNIQYLPRCLVFDKNKTDNGS
jgi:hypothetical protein